MAHSSFPFCLLQVEKAVLELFEQARAANLPVQRATIQAFGREACAALVSEASTDAERARYSGFNASEGWAKKFILRNNLISKPLKGETGSVEDEAVTGSSTNVHEMSATYEAGQTHGIVDTGVFSDVMPKRTYTSSRETPAR